MARATTSAGGNARPHSFTPEPFDTADILAEAIREHLIDRRWYRSQRHTTLYADLAHENDVALRALVAVARRARRLARAELVPLDTRGWAPGELTEAFGR